jgi:HAD superfamily hydrolase (TIGR01458 family)
MGSAGQRKESERKRIEDLRGFLIDLDGVLYTGTTPVPGSMEALHALDELHRMGYAIDPARILTPAVAAARTLVQQGKQSCLLLSTGDVHRDFEEHGIATDDPHADTVIVADAGDAFTYQGLTEAFRLLLSGGELLALEKDRFWMGDTGLMLSAGPFVAALEFASGKTSRLIGKPAKEFFLQAVGELRLDPGMVAMIGDDISSDILGAKACGMKGFLVKTGKFREEEVRRSPVRPDLIMDSLAALPMYLP